MVSNEGNRISCYVFQFAYDLLVWLVCGCLPTSIMKPSSRTGQVLFSGKGSATCNCITYIIVFLLHLIVTGFILYHYKNNRSILSNSFVIIVAELNGVDELM